MKLIFCPHCQDIRKLGVGRIECVCGKSWGHYLYDGINARIGGEAIPLGIDNGSFLQALVERTPHNTVGHIFEAFIIPRKSPTVNDGEPT